MPKPEKMILVCINQRPPGHPKSCCADKGARDISLELKNILDDKGLLGKISIAMTGCIGPCLHGPIITVMPDNIWYKEVSKEHVRKIVEEHLIGGKPVESLLLRDEDWA